MHRAGIKSRRALALKLHTDASLVGKWLNGRIGSIESLQHQAALPKILKTSPDYFRDPPRSERLARVEAEVSVLREVLTVAKGAHEDLLERVEAVEKELARFAGPAQAKPRGGRRK